MEDTRPWKRAADDAEARLAAVEGLKKQMDEALRERMSGTSAAKNKEFNAKQDSLTDRLDSAKKIIRDRQGGRSTHRSPHVI